MRKRILFTAATMGLVILSGCNNNNKDADTVTEAPENAPVEQEGTTTTQNNTNQTTDFAFQFTGFDLDVDYSGNKEYEVDYDNEQNGMEAEIKDDISNTKLQGDEAFAELSPIFEQFTFDQNTPDDEVISEVLKAFNLKDDYQNFELEVTFSDGTQKEYNNVRQ